MNRQEFLKNWMVIFYILLNLGKALLVNCVTIDNALNADPSIACDSQQIILNFRAQKPFQGKIFVRGYAQDRLCYQLGDGKLDLRFELRFDQCGLRRTREINGISIATTIIVSFHQIFLTKVDRAYRVNCFYMEASKPVSQQVEVSQLPTTEISQQMSMPKCRYEILSGGPRGQLVRYAKIGDKVYHKWTCDSEMPDVYCIRVHSCNVYDGQGGQIVPVLDENGCAADRLVFANLDYMSDLVAGQEAHVFKFADRPTLHFSCQLQLTLKDRLAGCAVTQPRCGAAQILVAPSSQTWETPPPPNQSGGYEATEITRLPEFGYMVNTPRIAYAGDEYTELTTSNGPPGYTPPPDPFVSEEYPEFSTSPGNGAYEADVGTRFSRSDYTPFLGTESYNRHPTQPDPYRLRRNATKTIADLDLPEQMITVFEINEDVNGIASGLTSKNNIRQVAMATGSHLEGKTCLSMGFLALLIGSGLLSVLTFIGLLVFCCLRKKQHEILRFY